MKRICVWIVVFISVLAGTLRLSALPSGLDTTFNVVGDQTVSFGGASWAYSVTLQSDGKSVLAGYASQAPDVFALARLTNAGVLDTSFNGAGTQTLLIGDAARANAVGVQSDGKIIATGRTTISGVNHMSVARFNADGSLDTSFNSTGTNVFTIGEGSTAYGLVMQGDGKIILAGFAVMGAYYKVLVVRLTTAGVLDTSFNTTGSQSVLIGADGFVLGQQVGLQLDGKIVVGGYTVDGGLPKVAATRLNTNGSLDTSFGVTGTQIVAIGTAAYGFGMAIQQDDKILISGYGDNNGGLDASVVRLTAGGLLDTSFNGTGSKFVSAGENSIAYSVAQQADGKIVLAGSLPGSNNMLAARLLADGLPDNGFAAGTYWQSYSLGTESTAQSLLIQPDTKILIAGRAKVGDFNDFAAWRLNGGGLPCCGVLWSLYNLWASV